MRAALCLGMTARTLRAMLAVCLTLGLGAAPAYASPSDRGSAAREASLHPAAAPLETADAAEEAGPETLVAAPLVAAPLVASPEPVAIPTVAPPAEFDAEAFAARAAAHPAPITDDAAIADLDAVLFDESADPISGVPTEPAAVPSGLPSRDEVQSAMASVVPAIRACAPGQQGRVVSVRTSFDSTGRVRSVAVEAPAAHLRPQERSCMARAARAAEVPAFDQETFEVSFPVRL